MRKQLFCSWGPSRSQQSGGVRAPESAAPSAGFTWICLKYLAWKLSFPHPASWERPEPSFSGEGRADPGSLLQIMPGLTRRVSAPASCAAGRAPDLGQPSLRGRGEGQASITSGSFMGLLWCAWNFTCLSFLVIFCPAANPE